MGGLAGAGAAVSLLGSVGAPQMVRKLRQQRAPAAASRLTPAAGSASASSSAEPASGPGVLFVCWGNICRSPAAEAVFLAKARDAGLKVGEGNGALRVDSCGTGGGDRDWYMPNGYSYHVGDPADARMIKAAAQRDVDVLSLSRPLTPADLSTFDYIIAMDAKNKEAILEAAQYWKGQGNPVPSDYASRVRMMVDYCRNHPNATHVPDPYFGGPDGFEKVLDLLDDACGGLLDEVLAASPRL
eukprot:jgi/Chlat1/6595/Chrsp46S06101